MTTSRLHDFLDHWADARPETEFAVQGERCLTYREALDAVNRLANAFVAAGLGVALLLASYSPQCAEVDFSKSTYSLLCRTLYCGFWWVSEQP